MAKITALSLLLMGTVVTEPLVRWQLGMCSEIADVTYCTKLGEPQDEQLCKAARDAIQCSGVKARAVCARVLVD